LERRLASIPGVTAAAISNALPPSGGTRGRALSTIGVEGQPPMAEGTGGMVAWRYITPGYFRALGIPLRAGRTFTEEDRVPGVNSVVVSAEFARLLFGREPATGKRIQVGENRDWFTVIGVVADVRNMGLEKGASPEFYLVRKPEKDAVFTSSDWRGASLVVRTAIGPRLSVPALRSAVAALDPALPVEVQTMEQRLGEITERPRFYAMLLGVFAATGVALAAIGLFGVMSFLVSQRRREIGVRMALGATPGHVVRLVLAFAGRWTGVGLVAGVAGSVVVSRWLRSLLFGVEAGDWRAPAAAIVVLAMVGLMAAVGPALGASRVDPVETLREE